MLDTHGILTDDVTLQLLQDADGAVNVAPGADLADAGDALVGMQLDEQVFAGGNQLQACDLHRNLLKYSLARFMASSYKNQQKTSNQKKKAL